MKLYRGRAKAKRKGDKKAWVRTFLIHASNPAEAQNILDDETSHLSGPSYSEVTRTVDETEETIIQTGMHAVEKERKR